MLRKKSPGQQQRATINSEYAEVEHHYSPSAGRDLQHSDQSKDSVTMAEYCFDPETDVTAGVKVEESQLPTPSPHYRHEMGSPLSRQSDSLGYQRNHWLDRLKQAAYDYGIISD